MCTKGIFLADYGHMVDVPFAHAVAQYIIAYQGVSHYINQSNIAVDFGCGNGGYVKILRSYNIKIDGYDGNPQTINISKGVGKIHDLTVPIQLDPIPDFVLCLEVLEHVPKEYEHLVLDNIHRNNTKGMIISWAKLGQPGMGHYNCQPIEYVLDTVTKLGYSYQEDVSKYLRNVATLAWFQSNACVFLKNYNHKNYNKNYI